MYHFAARLKINFDLLISRARSRTISSQMTVIINNPDTTATTVDSSDTTELEIVSGHFVIPGRNTPSLQVCFVVLSSKHATVNSSPCLKFSLFGEMMARVPPSPLYVQCPVWVMGSVLVL